jgi:hypothetical protein
MRALILRLSLCCLALLLGAAACNTPTIPLPPLSAPTFAALTAPDTWTASGTGAVDGAQIFVINRVSGDGVATRADATGAYTTPPFSGRTGDTIELFYRAPDGRYASSICARLQPTQESIVCPQ